MPELAWPPSEVHPLWPAEPPGGLRFAAPPPIDPLRLNRHGDADAERVPPCRSPTAARCWSAPVAAMSSCPSATRGSTSPRGCCRWASRSSCCATACRARAGHHAPTCRCRTRSARCAGSAHMLRRSASTAGAWGVLGFSRPAATWRPRSPRATAKRCTCPSTLPTAPVRGPTTPASSTPSSRWAGRHVHDASCEQLLGPDPSAALMATRSAEMLVNAKTPPCFVVHARDDSDVLVDNSIALIDRPACPPAGRWSRTSSTTAGMASGSAPPGMDVRALARAVRRLVAAVLTAPGCARRACGVGSAHRPCTASPR